MKWICAPSLIVAGIVALGAQEPMPSADAALAELKAGNAHFVAKKYDNPIRRRCANRRWRRARVLIARS